MIYNMARGFLKNGHEVVLAAAEDFRPIENERNEFQVIYFPSRFKSLFNPAYLPWPKGLRRYLKQNADTFDLVISVEMFSLPTLIAANICKDKLLVWHELAVMQKTMMKLPARVWHNIIIPLFIGNPKVVAQSADARAFISKYTGNVSEEIVAHGVNGDIFYPADGSDNYFVIISMLVYRKRIDRILQKFATFVKQPAYSNFKLRILGEGPEEEGLKKLADDLGISGSVSFEGFMSHDRIAEIGRRAKAMLIDTQKDCNMVTISESIVNGTPVLTNRVPTSAPFIEQYSLGIAKNNWNWQDMASMVENYDRFHNNCVTHRPKFTNYGVAKKLVEIFTNR